jgi:hypothetical protein
MTKQNPDDAVRREQFDNSNGDIESNMEEKIENAAVEVTGDRAPDKEKDDSGEAGDGDQVKDLPQGIEDKREETSDAVDDGSDGSGTADNNDAGETDVQAAEDIPDSEVKEDTKEADLPETEGLPDSEDTEAVKEEVQATEAVPDSEDTEAVKEEVQATEAVPDSGITGAEKEAEIPESEKRSGGEAEEGSGEVGRKDRIGEGKSQTETEADDQPGDAEDDFEEVTVSPDELEELPEVDYSGHTRAELVETLELLIENRPPAEIRDDVDKIKGFFYRRNKAAFEKLRQKFLEEGGNIEDFKAPDDPLEAKMRTLLSRYRGRKSEYSRQIEVEKRENLRKKYEIIDQIKDLVNREESINKTFQEFRDLQAEWHAVGMVPQSALKNLWETYNHNVELFYDYIKINKELRDLDFRKNLEKKILLCEKAEQLLKDNNALAAFRKLQDYHQQWRETGPVPRESREEVWERFREATSQINKRHHEHYEGQKEDQKKNLEAKRLLCERIDEINNLKISSFREWEDKAKVVIALQQEWRTIGFAPRKQNNTIYQRFREACDLFFQNKRNFYAENKEVQQENLQKKIALCESAEALQDSTDWKATSEELIKLQKEWKAIGTVPRKHSDKVWKRFRKACDHFFSKKAEHFSGSDKSFEENLKLKESLIRKVEEFEQGGNPEEALVRLNEMQKEWNEIGFVPFKKKDEITTRFREAINRQFDKLKMDDEEKAIFKYRTRLEGLKENPRASRKVRSERDKFMARIKQLESDITLWENNIGFFSKSASAEALIQDVQNKIDDAKNTILLLEEKIRIIDRSGLDD